MARPRSAKQGEARAAVFVQPGTRPNKKTAPVVYPVSLSISFSFLTISFFVERETQVYPMLQRFLGFHFRTVYVHIIFHRPAVVHHPARAVGFQRGFHGIGAYAAKYFFPGYADAHFTIHHKAHAAEHGLFFYVIAVADELADTVGQLFVIRHKERYL